MHYPSRSGISRRLFLQSTLATAVLPMAATAAARNRRHPAICQGDPSA